MTDLFALDNVVYNVKQKCNSVGTTLSYGSVALWCITGHNRLINSSCHMHAAHKSGVSYKEQLILGTFLKRL